MEPNLHQDSGAWVFFVHAAFVVALVTMLLGIWLLESPLWVKGYLAIGYLFTVNATFSLAKTVRDNHEARKIHHRIAEVKTERMLKEFERG